MQVICGGCNAKLRATEKLLGKTVRCPKCGRTLSVPVPRNNPQTGNLPATTLPTNPIPTNPVPTNPIPTNPVPTNPVPTNPVPTNPVPADLTPKLFAQTQPSQSKDDTKSDRPNVNLLVIGSVAVVAIIVISVLLFVWTGAEPDVAEKKENVSKRDTASNEKTAQSKNPQNDSDDSNAVASNQEAKPDSDPNLSAQTPLHLGIDQGYQVSIIENLNDESRTWSGNVLLRKESPSSTAEIEQILDSSRKKNKRTLRSIRRVTGIKVPNRWVLVGNQLAEGATKITVRIKNVDYEAIVRHRLKKGGFAVLQLENANLKKFPKLPIQSSGNNNKINKGPFHILWIDPNGEPRFVKDVKATSATSYAGGEYYYFLRTVPDDATTGIAFLNSGAAFGLVTESNFPSHPDIARAKMVPFSRVAKSWGEGARNVMFDVETESMEADFQSQKARFQPYLAEVIIERDPDSEPTLPLRYEINVESNNPNQMRNGDLKPPTNIRKKGLLELSMNEDKAWELPVSKARQLPFFLGDVIQNVMFEKKLVLQNKWTSEREIYLQEDGIYPNKKSPFAVAGRQVENFEILEESSTLVKVRRTIEVVSTEESRGTTARDRLFALPIRLEGVQIIDYSKETDTIINSVFNGTFTASSAGKKTAGIDRFEKIPTTSEIEMRIDQMEEPIAASWHLNSEN